ncbi:hypothetical protein L7F22_064401 [Adiantum nelumboides]|nr:hypothetical protein [Adiantum nelumboides]
MASSSSLAPVPDASAPLAPSLSHPVLAAFLSFVISQGLKVLASRYKEQRWDLARIFGSGGMPSSHAATVMGLATAIGLKDGPGGSLFAIAVVLASVVMYDASGVRLQAGHQAKVLNQIVIDLPREHPLSDSTPLRELLGHTPLQVTAGGILGCLVALFLQIFLYEATYESF